MGIRTVDSLAGGLSDAALTHSAVNGCWYRCVGTFTVERFRLGYDVLYYFRLCEVNSFIDLITSFEPLLLHIHTYIHIYIYSHRLS